jgi:RNA polymerase sigma-70 factor (ECF subfamily)
MPDPGRRPFFPDPEDYKRVGAAEYMRRAGSAAVCLPRGGLPVYDRSGTAAEYRPDARARPARTSAQRAEFAELLARHQGQLLGYIYSLVRDLDDADDLFQQSSLVLWDKFDQFDPSRSFVGWACGVARYEVLNFLRARSRDRLYFSDELSLALIEAQEELEQERLEERRMVLAGCMKKLPDRDKDLLEACYDRSSGVREVARARGRSPQSIHNSLRRIRRALFDCVRRSLAQGGIA